MPDRSLAMKLAEGKMTHRHRQLAKILKDLTRIQGECDRMCINLNLSEAIYLAAKAMERPVHQTPSMRKISAGLGDQK